LYTLQQLAEITGAELFTKTPHQSVHHFFTDSRQAIQPNSLFIALHGERFNGHDYIADISAPKIAFLVSEQASITDSASFLLVKDTQQAFQQIAAHHRSQFSLPVVGITGSYGKTIVKEWLFQLLSPNLYVCKSPKSYNSQIGVPLSVLQLTKTHQFALFEAGISKTGEMQKLANIIRPNIGIITNIGDAHNEGFRDHEQKMKEKLLLFEESDVLIYEDNSAISFTLREAYSKKKHISWTALDQKVQLNGEQFDLPATNSPYFAKNIGHCIALMKHLGFSSEEIVERCKALQTLPMRLEISNGKLNSTILNDSYSNDLSGLRIALEHAKKVAPQKQLSLILSSFQESGLTNDRLTQTLTELFSSLNIENLILIGDSYVENNTLSTAATSVCQYSSTEAAMLEHDWKSLNNQMVVVKGARIDRLERIVSLLKSKTHQTVWEINLSHLIENLNYFKSRLQKGVKLLAMVKATAYGTEADKIAQTLQDQNVDYLGVAYPEEGVALRNEGIHLPILVMNCAEAHFHLALSHQLEIQVFSLDQLKHLISHCRASQKKANIHIKLETGMNRLGFQENELPILTSLLAEAQDAISVTGILSHLATADDLHSTEFAEQQIAHFEHMANQILPHCSQQPLLHILNSSAMSQRNFSQFDMVRLGIGLHGISSLKETQSKIKQVGALLATISQVKTVKIGESVGYGRAFTAQKETRVATVTIGYADGYDRRLGNGKGEMLVHNKRAKTLGNICMDMCMVDVTDIPQAKAGDEVIVSNEHLPINELATKIGTIPYELLTSISSRVQRRFIYE